jgi:thioredoxin-related protein
MLMRKILCLLLLTVCVHAESSDWLTDFSAARKKAAKENKRIMMLFTGSDWCPICKKWKKEVFDQPQFLDYSRTNLVLVLVDFPDQRPLPRAQQRANDALRDKWKAGEFPEVILLDPAGKKEVGRIRYDLGGIPRVIALLNGEKFESPKDEKGKLEETVK